MNIPEKDILYIYKALTRLQQHEPDYPGLAAGIKRLGVARDGGTDRALESSWWEKQLVREMFEQEKEQWKMDEQPF